MTIDIGTATKTDGAAPASTCRNPRLDPQPGDRLDRDGKKGVRTRRVTGRNGYEITYVESHYSLAARAILTSKPKTCWLSTWQAWAKEARVHIGALKVSPNGDSRIVRDPGDIFAMSKEEACKLLSGLEMEGTLTKYVQEHYPQYIDKAGGLMAFKLAIDLGF